MPISLDPLPMQEAQSFWRDKVKLGPGEFAKISSEAKVKAFAVSGIAKGAELDTVFTALQRAIDDGISFGEFKKQCAEIIERRGWTGKRAWRVDNIFRTNIQTAYNVGHYKQLMADGDLFPYWQYSAVNDSRTRPTHLAMNGRVWPASNPVWNTWFPPNGYRCRCSVIGITRAQAERRGLTIEQDDPTNGLIEPIDFGTGNRMPAVQLLPDPGFAHNPGKVYWQGLAEVLADKIEQWAPDLRSLAVKDLVGNQVFEAWLSKPEGDFPVGVLSAVAAEQIGATSVTVRLSPESAAKQLLNHPELMPAEYVAVQDTIDRGKAVRDGEQSLIYILDERPGYVSVVKATLSGETVFLTSFRRLSGAEVKRSEEMTRLLSKEGN